MGARAGVDECDSAFTEGHKRTRTADEEEKETPIKHPVWHIN